MDEFFTPIFTNVLSEIMELNRSDVESEEYSFTESDADEIAFN